MATVRVTLLSILILMMIVARGSMAQVGPVLRHVSLETPTKTIEPAVDFLEYVPVIDGRLDESLRFLPERPFTFAYLAVEDTAVDAHYRLAYGSTFLYLYIEMAADQLIYRDRAYQNGDGFDLVIAAPRPDQASTDEFYVLACSAVNEPSQEWTRHIFWYYNVDRIFVPTSENTRLECSQGDGKIRFELVLPWTDIHPYHPWLSEGIGFNLLFVKAAEPDRVMLYGVVEDPDLDSEQHKRQYAILPFQRPAARHSIHTFAQPVRGHINVGDSLEIALVGVAPDARTSEVAVGVYSGEGERMLNQRFPLTCDSTIQRKSLWLNTTDLAVGGYTVRWNAGGRAGHGERGLTVLPAVDLSVLGDRVEAVGSKVSASSVNTMQFLLGETQRELQSIHPYESCGNLRVALDGLIKTVERAEQGSDDLARATGFVRKAYRSSIDGSLQPYMVWLPPDYSRERHYPLFVYLHGSASDERSFTKRGARDIIPKGFIAVAPFGRGKSNAFSGDHAQEDIADVITAVSQDYSVDTGAVLLGGFSMGGYGVYRTAYETPSKFRALAIISGDPSLGARYTGDSTQPDFLEDKNLRAFRNLPVFVFHGEKDRNCPYATTQKLVEKLRKAQARVLFVSEPEKGHDFPDAVTIKRYEEWVEGIFAKAR